MDEMDRLGTQVVDAETCISMAEEILRDQTLTTHGMLQCAALLAAALKLQRSLYETTRLHYAGDHVVHGVKRLYLEK